MQMLRLRAEPTVADVVGLSRDGAEELIRVVGLDVTDYLTAVEASALARALAAAVNEVSSDDELAPPG